MVTEKDRQLIELKKINHCLEEANHRLNYDYDKAKLEIEEMRINLSRVEENELIYSKSNSSKVSVLEGKIIELTDILEQQQNELDVYQ